MLLKALDTFSETESRIVTKKIWQRGFLANWLRTISWFKKIIQDAFFPNLNNGTLKKVLQGTYIRRFRVLLTAAFCANFCAVTLNWNVSCLPVINTKLPQLLCADCWLPTAAPLTTKPSTHRQSFGWLHVGAAGRHVSQVLCHTLCHSNHVSVT